MKSKVFLIYDVNQNLGILYIK